MLEVLFIGLSLGSILLLVALGLAITYGAMGVINMAHGEMVMVGAYVTVLSGLWLGTNIFVPRFGPKVMVPIGMTIGAVGMLILTRLDLDSTYAANVLPPLMILGLGMGTIMPAAIQTATLGVDRQFAGVASALVNTSQQVGGSIGTALLNTLAATAAANYLADHVPPSATVAAEAAVHSYSVAYRWDAGIFAFGAVLAALLFKRRAKTQQPATDAAPAPDSEPVAVH